jgi:phenylpropionate dioxygenase-like ring-hydroxylating dioxygenase large terminal subunit
MFFGRNEECGLRCVYHGWKFDLNGDCVDMPSEPADSNFKDKVKIKAYPAQDFGGVIWLYMGPQELKPEVPQFEWARVPESHRLVSRWVQKNNYMQAVEGEIDTAHGSYLHSRIDPTQRENGFTFAGSQDGAPVLTVRDTDYGFVYGSRRNAADGEFYWRVTQWLLPSYALIPGGDSWPKLGHMYFPIDDEHLAGWEFLYNPEAPLTDKQREEGLAKFELFPSKFKLSDGATINTFNMQRTSENDYLIDREMQRNEIFTGIAGTRNQDRAMTESMGAISDRTGEHLGTSDAAIIAARRRLLKMARDLQEGVEPVAPYNGSLYHIRQIAMTVPEGDFDDFLNAYSDEGVGKV